jgi:hypothetical protein
LAAVPGEFSTIRRSGRALFLATRTGGTGVALSYLNNLFLLARWGGLISYGARTFDMLGLEVQTAILPRDE